MGVTRAPRRPAPGMRIFVTQVPGGETGRYLVGGVFVQLAARTVITPLSPPP
jgi:hypothetical protein